MPSPELIAAFDAANDRHTAAVADFVPLLVEMALASIAEVLPGASVLETEGEMNEDWVFTLRIQRVLDAGGEVLYDIDSGHDDTEVETKVDEVGVDYLDLLLDLTGEEYLGRQTNRPQGEHSNQNRQGHSARRGIHRDPQGAVHRTRLVGPCPSVRRGVRECLRHRLGSVCVASQGRTQSTRRTSAFPLRSSSTAQSTATTSSQNTFFNWVLRKT